MKLLSKTQSMGVAALLLSASMLVSRFMGLARDKIISWQFGAGGEADMYFAAFVIPDIINYLLAGGFMSITLIPLLSKRFAENEEDGWRFFSCVLSWMTSAAFVLTVAGGVFAPYLARLASPGLAETQYVRLAFFMRLVLPAQLFFVSGSCLMSYLYYKRQFTVPALTPLIYNSCIILSGLAFPHFGLAQGMTGYCIGVSIGAGLGAFLLPLISACQNGLRFFPSLRHPLMKRFIWLALPLMLGQTIAALDEQFLRIFGSLAGEGSVSLLNYAKRISQVPIALVGQAAAAASYPFLVKLLTQGDTKQFSDMLSLALRSAVSLMVPCVLWMAFLSPSVFTLIFYGGRMSMQEMGQAVPLLQIMLAAGPCWVVYALLARAYYAQSDTLTPAVSGTLLTVAFLPVYYFWGVPQGAFGVASVSAASMLVYVLVLAAIWIKRQGSEIFRGLIPSALRSGLCALPGCLVGWQADIWIREVTNLPPTLSSLLGLSVSGTLFLACTLPLCVKFCPEITQPVLSKIKNRLGLKKA